MPLVHSVVSEADSHIYLPVLKQVAHHLVQSLNIGQYIKDDIYIDTGRTSAKSGRKNHTFFVRKNGLHIQAEQLPYGAPAFDFQSFAFSLGHGFHSSNRETHMYELFKDPVSEITLHESILPTSFNLQCTLWLLSRNIADETLKKIMLRFATGHPYNLSLNYDYPVPKDITSAMVELHKHRKFDVHDPVFGSTFAANQKVTFADWLDKGSRANFVTMMNRTNTNRELCISKVLDNPLIQVNCEVGKPTEEKQNKSIEHYSIPLVVQVQFEEPAAIVMKYPCVVDSIELGEHLIPTIRRNDSPIQSTIPRSNNDLINENFQNLSAVRVGPDGIIQYPYYDDWVVPWNHLFRRSYRPFFISGYLAETDTPQLKLNLSEPLADEVILHPIVLEVLKAQGNESFKDDCIFNISSYMRNSVQIRTEMDLDAALNLIVSARDIHPQRHLVISEITDLRYLNPKWYEWYEKYPGYFKGDQQLPGYTTDPKNNGENDATNYPKRIFRACLIPRRPNKRNRPAGSA